VGLPKHSRYVTAKRVVFARQFRASMAAASFVDLSESRDALGTQLPLGSDSMSRTSVGLDAGSNSNGPPDRPARPTRKNPAPTRVDQPTVRRLWAAAMWQVSLPRGCFRNGVARLPLRRSRSLACCCRR
jgi:hypothetical protein